jgi:hypothetical protein
VSKTDSGIFFEVMNGVRRSVYRQDDRTLILADSCKCTTNYLKIDPNRAINFEIVRNPVCPIDEHRRLI